MFILRFGSRKGLLYRSGLPAILFAKAPIVPSSPRRNLLISSRKHPFHSAHLSPTKDPTWYNPAASQASAIILVLASMGSDSISQRIGGFSIGLPCSSLDMIDARSKRNPSTCISVTHLFRASIINRLTTE